MWIMAALPILLLIVCMTVLKWSAVKAALAGMCVSLIGGAFFYQGGAALLAVEAGKSLWNALIIILIVWTAILLYQVSQTAGAFSVIRQRMRSLMPNELLLVLFMGWIFESFLQGITGFGVPVAVGAPLLLGIGVSPAWAVILPLLGQAWGNTFGTLAAAWDALAMAAGLSAGGELYARTALQTALILWVWNLMAGLLICWFYGKKQALKKGLPAVLLLSAIQGGGEALLSQVSPVLCCFLPACASLLAAVLLAKTGLYREAWRVEDSGIMNRQTVQTDAPEAEPDMSLMQAFMPYVVLAVLALVVLAVPPVTQLLGRVKLGFPVPQTQTGYDHVNAGSDCYAPISIFTHASVFLLASAAAGFVYYRRRSWIGSGGLAQILKQTTQRTRPSALAMLALVAMSGFMSGTGQTMILARGIAAVLGRGYIFVAPFIGLLGTFITGSNMSANILFGNFQLTTAQLLAVSPAPVLAAQTAGASIGSVISPSKILLGTTMVHLEGQEGGIMRKLLLCTLPAAVLLGVMTVLLAGLGT